MDAEAAAKHRGALFVVFLLALAGLLTTWGDDLGSRLLFAVIALVPVTLWLDGAYSDEDDDSDAFIDPADVHRRTGE